VSSTLLKRAASLALFLSAAGGVALAQAGEPRDKLSALRTPQAKASAQKAQRPMAKLGGEPRCGGVSLRAKGGEPFSVGEELAYEITVAGVYVGRMETKVGKPRVVEGHKALSLFGRARTNAFASSFKKFAGRYMTLVDPEGMAPIGMRVDSTYGDDPRWEKVRFSDGNRKVTGSFSYEGKEGSRSYAADERLMDVLAILYYARTRELNLGAEGCQHVFGARWLWRMDAKVKGFATVDTPAGKKDATVVQTTFRRSPHPDLTPNQKDQKFEMEVYFARDQTQAPLEFVIRLNDLTAVGKLVAWSLKDKGEDGWAF
jgi:hypothetical protein